MRAAAPQRALPFLPWLALPALLAGCGVAGDLGPDAAPGPGGGTGIEAAWPLEGPPADEPVPVPPGRIPPDGPYLPGIDVLGYDVELALSDTARWFAGRARVRFRRTARTDSLRLDLSGLSVVRTAVDGRPVGFRHERARVHVPLPDAGPGDTLTVEVVYGGVPDDGLILQENLYGKPTAFADNWPDRARFWFPSVDHPSDKATVRFRVHAPPDWTVVANGALVGVPGPAPGGMKPTGPGGRTWEWVESAAVPTYAMVVAGAPLVRGEVGRAACGRAPLSPGRCVEVDWYAFEADTAEARRIFRRAARMVDVFVEEVADFPYEKLSNLQSSTRFGGMENASAIFYSERAISGGSLSEGTVAHEIAHQWFGDSVTESDWHHLWLSEGFATYYSALFFRREDGEAAFDRSMEAARRRYLASEVTDVPIVNPAQDDLFELLNANNYQKGAWVLRMLSDLVGEEAFRRGIRDYYLAHRDSTALTEDLRRAVESASGRELGWFFEQWVFRPGHPVLEGGWSWEDGVLVLDVRQVQPERWPTFRFPLDVEASRAGEPPTRVVVEVDERSETFRIPLPSPPEAVRLDPGERLLAVIAGPLPERPRIGYRGGALHSAPGSPESAP